MRQNHLSSQRFEEIQAQLASGDTTIKLAIEQLIERADKAMKAEPPHVRLNGGSPFFHQDGAYVPDQDGVHNTEANHKSRELAHQFADSSFILALAYRITGNTGYADKALDYIHTWCINQNTRMFATGYVQNAATPGAVYGGDIVIFASFFPAFKAMKLLDNYTGWDIEAHAAVQQWVRDMIEPQRKLMFYDGASMYNNWDDARLLYLTCGAVFLNDLQILTEIFNRWRVTMPLKMTTEGELPRETMRTRSMNYTVMALSKMSQTAELAQSYGVNLFDYEINGISLKLGVDFACRHLADPDTWPFKLIHPLEYELPRMRFQFLEIAHSHWGDQQYLDILDKYKKRTGESAIDTIAFARKTV